MPARSGDRPPDSGRIARLELGPVAYTLRRSHRSRGVRVTVDPLSGVVVSVPPTTRRGWADPDERVETFLLEREGWLRRHLARHEYQRAIIAGRGPLADGGQVRFAGELHALRVVESRGVDLRSLVARRVLPDGPTLVIERAPSDPRSLAAVLRDWCRERARESLGLAVAGHAAALAVEPAALALRDPRSRWGSASRAGRLSFSWRLVLAPPDALETVVVHELAHLRAFGHGPRFWAIVASRKPDHAIWRRWLRDHAHELHAAFADADADADLEAAEATASPSPASRSDVSADDPWRRRGSMRQRRVGCR